MQSYNDKHTHIHTPKQRTRESGALGNAEDPRAVLDRKYGARCEHTKMTGNIIQKLLLSTVQTGYGVNIIIYFNHGNCGANSIFLLTYFAEDNA